MTVKAGGGQRCDVYWAQLSWLAPAHVSLLSAAELDRRARFHRREDRDRFTLAAALLRVVLAERFESAPTEIQVDRTCDRCGEQHGRPRVPGYPVELSVSHSGEFAAVAVSTAGPTGIDVEHARPLDHRSLWGDVFGPEDDEARSLAAFYRGWTRKESILKATGVGLALPMSAVRVTRTTEPPALLAYPGEPGLRARMADIPPAEEYAGAVSVLSAWPVVFREWHPRELLEAVGAG